MASPKTNGVVRCEACKKPIGRSAVIFDSPANRCCYDVDCFRCCRCNEKLSDRYLSADGESGVYCRRCFADQFAPKCSGCQQPIIDVSCTIVGLEYHIQCAKCNDCSRKFTGCYYKLDSYAYCLKCFWKTIDARWRQNVQLPSSITAASDSQAPCPIVSATPVSSTTASSLSQQKSS